MKLPQAKEGQQLVVVETGGADMTMQSLRFGIDVGAHICLIQKISGGPVIVSRNELEIAIGRQLAMAIEVRPYKDDDDQ